MDVQTVTNFITTWARSVTEPYLVLTYKHSQHITTQSNTTEEPQNLSPIVEFFSSEFTTETTLKRKHWNRFVQTRTDPWDCVPILHVYTAISKKVVIVNSRYWNRKELGASNSRNNLLLLAMTLHNIEWGSSYNDTVIQQRPPLVCYHS